MSKSKKAKIERQSVWDEGLETENQFYPSADTKSFISFKGMFCDEIRAMLLDYHCKRCVCLTKTLRGRIFLQAWTCGRVRYTVTFINQRFSTAGPWTGSGWSANMYVYGDVRMPLPETVSLVEEIVFLQISELLLRAAEVASMRSSREICLAEFLFLLRHDAGKLNRFVSRMKFMDSHSQLVPAATTDDMNMDFDLAGINSLKRYKRCMQFLIEIDEFGELQRVATAKTVDDIKMKRNERAEKQTRSMNTPEYMEFVKLRRVAFSTKKGAGQTRKKRLRDWFDLEKMGISEPVSEFGWDAIEYLGQETIAELVDKALLVRSETLSPLLPCELEPDSRHLPVYASESLLARAENVGDTTGRTNDERPLNRKLALTPNVVREAMRRFTTDYSNKFDVPNIPGRTNRKLLCLN